MKIFGRSPIALFLGTAAVFGGLIGFSYTIGKDSFVGSITTTFVDKAKEAASEKLDALKGLTDKFDKKSDGETLDPSDHHVILNACMDTMFYTQGEFHFSQSRWGAKPMPYQFRGLDLIGPQKMALNGADAMKGIDERLLYKFHVESYRRYDKTEGWGDWIFELPPNLDAIILAKQENEWKIVASPMKSYSLR